MNLSQRREGRQGWNDSFFALLALLALTAAVQLTRDEPVVVEVEMK